MEDPIKDKETTRVSIEIRAKGKSAEMMKFLEVYDSTDHFRQISTILLGPDRKDPEIVTVQARIQFWYAASEKADRSAKNWKAKHAPNPSVVELLNSFVKLIGDRQVALTGYSFEEGEINLSGEAENFRTAAAFVGKLFKEPSLDHYAWVWVKRPHEIPKRDDGSVAFKVLGILKYAKKEKKSKSPNKELDHRPGATDPQ